MKNFKSSTLVENFKEVMMFNHVAESRSFTTAAQRLDITPAGVSKGVARLEAALGVKLLNRSTRNVSLTDDGEILLARWREIIVSAQEAESELSSGHDSLRGKLKIHAPVGLGRKVLMPVLVEMAKAHPNLIINADFSDRVPNMVEEGLDVVVKIGEVSDSRMIAKKIGHLRYVTCATPDYLKKWGVPVTPLDLDRHNCIAYVQWQTGSIRKWIYEKNGENYIMTPAGNISVNHPEAILDAVLSGAGIARMASFIAATSVMSGKLQMILSDWMPEGPEMHLVYQPSKYLSPRVKTFIQCVADAIPPYLPWEKQMGLPAPQEFR
ncbi:LysR family transcriptional regulator [Noviherbaspirillum sp. Root189]|uniref:LysR family transcriptional regulator n=1 Tax=Noviherbaspirillum sp. Root189 TaxID=1736487 RepID=UPI00070F41B5|nr:LysR family transcriptional regulator [Noviherbaspirillum sp. Root189]KRB67935.1 LysR family transcriptional regulator [Noviherbaspirillum sp. Root189]